MILYDDMMTKRKTALDEEVAPHLIIYHGRYTKLKLCTKTVKNIFNKLNSYQSMILFH